MRQVSTPRLLDEIAAAATVASAQEELDGWWCKAAPELPFRRANAALPPPAATADRAALDAAYRRVAAWYRAHGRRLIVQVSSASPDHRTLDAWLAARRLVAEAPVHVMVADLDVVAAAGPAGGVADQVEIAVGVDEGWAHDLGLEADGPLPVRTDAYGRLLEAVGDRGMGAVVRRGGEVAGLGFGLIDRGWMGVFGMATMPAHRRQGIASGIVAALAAAARRHPSGCDAVYLQVEVDNHPAIATYRRCGFAVSHGYHYRSEGHDPEQGC